MLTEDRYSKIVACSLVDARFDYANSVLFGVTRKNILKIQMVKNTLAHVVTGLRRRDHIMPTLKRLHWLPIKSRINFKIASLTFKVRSTNQPAYLASLISSYHTGRLLRSADHYRLTILRVRTAADARTFSAAAPLIWINLPYDITTSFDSFRRNLKSYFFTITFE